MKLNDIDKCLADISVSEYFFECFANEERFLKKTITFKSGLKNIVLNIYRNGVKNIEDTFCSKLTELDLDRYEALACAEFYFAEILIDDVVEIPDLIFRRLDDAELFCDYKKLKL